MHTERYIPEEFIVSFYGKSGTHEFTFNNYKNVLKKPKNSLYDRYRSELKSETVYKNEPNGNYKINSNHYIHLDYFSVVDGVMIEDSRGFVFKISNANFIQLARECTIRNGTIEDECVIGFDKHARPTLVKVGSDFYKEVMKYTSKQNHEFQEKDLVEGKVYRFKNEQHKAYVYLGKHKIKNKRDTFYFEASVVQPKVPQHVFAFVFEDGSVSSQYQSAKVSSIQEEVTLTNGVTTKFENVITHFKNCWQGRVLESVSVEPMTNEEADAVRKCGNETYVVMKYRDGSFHLAVNNGRNYGYGNEYIAPLDPKTMMPFMNDRMKKHWSPSREESAATNSSSNEWHRVTFKFEDPRTIDF